MAFGLFNYLSNIIDDHKIYLRMKNKYRRYVAVTSMAIRSGDAGSGAGGRGRGSRPPG